MTDWIDKSWDIVWKCAMTNSRWWIVHTSPGHPFYLRSKGQMSRSAWVCTLLSAKPLAKSESDSSCSSFCFLLPVGSEISFLSKFSFLFSFFDFKQKPVSAFAENCRHLNLCRVLWCCWAAATRQWRQEEDGGIPWRHSKAHTWRHNKHRNIQSLLNDRKSLEGCRRLVEVGEFN